MTASAWLSRVRLRRDPAVRALAGVLLPENDDARIGVAHRLLWTLFADGPERRRDFLWREQEGEQLDRLSFLVLSARCPVDRLQLFDLDPPKPYEPALVAGDRLGFSLRANAVVTRRRAAGGRSSRHDVVMDALKTVPPGEERAVARGDATMRAGRAWLAAQGDRNGFAALGDVRVDGYLPRRIPREGREPVCFSTLDFDGVLEVTDPPAFLAALSGGFGKAKAWGCGLMLIRRAR